MFRHLFVPLSMMIQGRKYWNRVAGDRKTKAKNVRKGNQKAPPQQITDTVSNSLVQALPGNPSPPLELPVAPALAPAPSQDDAQFAKI